MAPPMQAAHSLDTPLVLPNNALAAGGDVLGWAPLEGVKLAKQGAATGLIPKSSPPVAELFKTFSENGGESAYARPAPRPTASRGRRIDSCRQALNTPRLRR
jgi:predicted peroxiredoxin